MSLSLHPSLSLSLPAPLPYSLPVPRINNSSSQQASPLLQRLHSNHGLLSVSVLCDAFSLSLSLFHSLSFSLSLSISLSVSSIRSNLCSISSIQNCVFYFLYCEVQLERFYSLRFYKSNILFSSVFCFFTSFVFLFRC